MDSLEQVVAPKRQRTRDRSGDIQSQRQKRLEKTMSIPFIGVDGEGGDIPDDQMKLFGEADTRHEYMLLRAGDQVLETGRPLTWHDCFGFLADLPKPGNYVSYFFDYDVTMMVRGLTPDRLYRLLRRQRPEGKNGELLPVDVGEFQIDYLPHKEFKVRRRGGDWTVIQDTGTFFQSAFIKTLDLWQIGTDEERRMIREGKALRSEFGQMTDEIRFYNALECRLLADLMGEFREVCKQLGYLPSRWEGPGLLATAAFKKHHISRSRDLEVMSNGELMNFARSAYYGGRFEIGTVGPTPEVEQWDINSAYPFCIEKLPCLLHGEWSKGDVPTSDVYCSKVRFEASGNSHYYGFPVRDRAGNIRFPAAGIGWYWSPEVEAVKSGPYQSVEYIEVWSYRTSCSCKPFGFVQGIYNARKRLGKNAKGLILKLVLNSLYGKMAQSIGKPAYANPIWAGLITSMTRAIILEAINSVEDTTDIHMIATDGIFATKGALSLEESDQLGGWSREEHSGMFIIQPGLYFTGDGTASPKTRGVPQSAVVAQREDFLNAFDRLREGAEFSDESASVLINLPTFLGAKACLHRDNLSMAGMWVNEPRRVTFDWTSKRTLAVPEGEYLRPVPYPGDRDVESVPYSRTLGVSLEVLLIDMIREEVAGQPDWVPLTLI